MITRRKLLQVAGVTGISASIPQVAFAEGGKRKPNIVVILADDLGYGDVSFLNVSSKAGTLYMDALAKEGVFLTDAHAPSAIFSPTRYSILTGRYAWRNPALERGVLMPWDEPAIQPTEITIPALLKKAGYATACIGKKNSNKALRRTQISLAAELCHSIQ